MSKTCKTSAFKEACAAAEDYITRKADGQDVDAELFPEPEENDTGFVDQGLAEETGEDGDPEVIKLDDNEEVPTDKDDVIQSYFFLWTLFIAPI